MTTMRRKNVEPVIHLTIAPREEPWQEGCIERASVQEQDSNREATGMCGSTARVAWRVLGSPHLQGPWAGWMYSCRTPLRLRDERFEAGAIIGDGSDAAMIAWVTGETP